MGRRWQRTLGLLVLAAVAFVAGSAGAATLNKRARLREGPSKESKLLGWVDQGATVGIESEHNGWYAVRTPDGQTGFVWQEHLRLDGTGAGVGVLAEGAPPSTAVTITAATPATSTAPAAPVVPPTLETRAASTTDRSEPSVVAELERLRAEIARLATAQQELAQRPPHGERGDGPPTPISNDGSAGAAVVFFGVGAVAGWLFGRFAPSRRERRSRLRL